MKYIYIIKNKINKKSYIGVTNNFERRIKEHFQSSSRPTNKFLKKDIDLYGMKNFEYGILEKINDSETSEKEKYWINKYQTFKEDKGYNRTIGGIGGNTYEFLDSEKMNDIKKRISESKKGKNNPISQNPDLVRGKNNPMYGKIPHNAKKVIAVNIETNEEFEFNSLREFSDFLGYKTASPVYNWIKDKKKDNIRGYKLK